MVLAPQLATWPSGLGKGLQSPVPGFDSLRRLYFVLRLVRELTFLSDSSEGSRFEGSRYLFATFLRLESTAPMIAEAFLSALYLFIFNAERSICRLDQGHPDEAPCLSPRKFLPTYI